MRSEESPTSFYATNGPVTSPGEYAYMLESLPLDVKGICAALRGLLQHPRELGIDLAAMSPNQRSEVELIFVRDILACIADASSRPLTEARTRENRIIGHCRHFAVLLTAALRQRGVPARVRVGFATYFPSPMNEDHWVCEYWNATEERWVLVDGQLESHLAAYRGIDFSSYDVPRSRFIVAGQVWRECKAGHSNPRLYGFSKKLHGYGCIAESLVRDVAALNKVELLPWTRLWMGITQHHEQPENRALLDILAELTVGDDCQFEEVLAVIRGEPGLYTPLTESGLLPPESDVDDVFKEPIHAAPATAGVKGHMWAVLQTALYREKVA